MTIQLPFLNREVANPFSQDQIEVFTREAAARRAENPARFDEMRKTIVKIAQVAMTAMLAIVTLPLSLPICAISSFFIGTPLTVVLTSIGAISAYNVIRNAIKSLDRQMPYLASFAAGSITRQPAPELQTA